MKKFCFLLMAVFAVLASCDYVKPPYSTTPDTGNDTDIVVKVRKVLLEDYTGHTCGNCPKAARVADQIKKDYGEKVVVIGVHAGGFASPDPPKYPSDFRNPVSTELHNFFGLLAAGNPNGMVNRAGYPNNHIKGESAWNTEVSAQLAKELSAFITIKNSFDASTRKIDTEVSTEFEQTLQGDFKLAVYLVEDSIQAPQKDYTVSPDWVQNYMHKHVLRASFNGSSQGELIAGNPVKGNPAITKKYSLTLDPSFDASHCYVVAFVYNSSTWEVLQAEEKKIK
jgi:thiol-disulfide isomerase/thioredoxin